MKKKLDTPTLNNILKLFSSKLGEFKGESKRSYQKAFSSFQLYAIGNYPLGHLFDSNVIDNWIADNIISGLTPNTVGFYLDKISALYSGIAGKILGGKTLPFKEIKKNLKNIPSSYHYSEFIAKVSSRISALWNDYMSTRQMSPLLEAVVHFSETNPSYEKKSVRCIWACVALKAGIMPDIVKGMIGDVPARLAFLRLCNAKETSLLDKEEVVKAVAKSLRGEEPQWFAMRLRPKVKFEGILDRFAQNSETLKMPEFFYPCEEIARQVGRKIVWKGKPVIRDVIFFKSRKSEIYPMFTKLYDLAWCYRNPGGNPGNYASIPAQAMDEFREALGFLNKDLEIAPAGEMKLRPGDKVVIVNGDYARKAAQIIKSGTESEEGNIIYRVKLLDSNGQWDICIDARLLKKAESSPLEFLLQNIPQNKKILFKIVRFYLKTAGEALKFLPLFLFFLPNNFSLACEMIGNRQ